MKQADKQAKLKRILENARKEESARRNPGGAPTWELHGTDRVWRDRLDAAWGWRGGGIMIELTPERAAAGLPAEEAVSPAQRATIEHFDGNTSAIRRQILGMFRETFGAGRRGDDTDPLTLQLVVVRAQETGIAPLCLALRGSRYDDGEHGLTALFENGGVVEVGTADLFPRAPDGDWGV